MSDTTHTPDVQALRVTWAQCIYRVEGEAAWARVNAEPLMDLVTDLVASNAERGETIERQTELIKSFAQQGSDLMTDRDALLAAIVEAHEASRGLHVKGILMDAVMATERGK